MCLSDLLNSEIILATIEDRISQLRKMFISVADWEARYSQMIKLGKEMAPFPEEGRQDKFLIKGCQSKVWLFPHYDKQTRLLKFFADSDSVLVKGIVSILVHVYSDHTPEEVLQASPDFLKELGITEHLSMNRNNGLVAMLKQIQLYAQVLKLQNQ